MEIKNLICINCPMGCALTVETEGGEVVSVSGNTCIRGDTYARREVTAPRRTVTSSVRVENGRAKMVSVKTREEIPKEKIFACMAALKTVTARAPVRIGDVIVPDIAGTGVDVVATRDVDDM